MNAESQGAETLLELTTILHSDAGLMPKNDFVIQDNTEMNVRATAFQAQCLMRNLKTQTLIERAEMLHNDAGQMAKNDLVAQGTAE